MKCFHSHLRFPVVAAVILCGFSIQSASGSSHNERAVLRRCAGIYMNGRWIKAKARDIPTGMIVQNFPTLPLKLRLPSGRGKTVSKIDVSPFAAPGSSTLNTRLITRWRKPDVRRGGRLIIYRGKTVWYLSDQTGSADFPGRIIARLQKNNRRAIINQGRIRVFRPADDKIFGKIKAKR